ncbi:MAG: class I SAM-dependent rRNA methyltransferase [Gammaproteobacteria bacterium]
MPAKPLVLKKGEDRRLRAGHLWVYSNEVDTHATPLHDLTPGDSVTVLTSGGKTMGTGYANPHSLICARLLDRDRPWSTALCRERLKRALALRERLFDEPYYRLVYADSDGLPGLVVDRYADLLVAQFNTAGMERRVSDVIDSLREVLDPKAILLRNDSPSRLHEGLDLYVEAAFGQAPEEISLTEHGARFYVPVLSAQKTGWYYDQRANRARMLRYVKGLRILDVFSYLGAWGIQAAHAGARFVQSIESSADALRYIERNARENDVRIVAEHGEAFATLKNLHDAAENYDVVILDPPAFIKKKKDLAEGLLAYRRLNQWALHLVRPGGILMTASCSYHLTHEGFVDVLRRASLRAGREIQLLEQGHQSPDHPIHPAIPETNYLKAAICRVL